MEADPSSDFVLLDTRPRPTPSPAGLTVSTLVTLDEKSNSTMDQDNNVFSSDPDTYIMNPSSAANNAAAACCNSHNSLQQWPRRTISCVVVLAVICVGSSTLLYLSSATQYIR